MKKLKFAVRVVFTLSLFFSAIGYIYSETGYGVGVTSGYTYVYTEAKFIYNCESCGHMSDNHSNGYFAGVSYEYYLKEFLDFSLIAKLYYNRFNFFSSKPDNLPVLARDAVDTSRYTTVYATTSLDYYGKVDYLNFDFTPKIKIPYINLNVFAGISISYMIASSYSETLNIHEPTWATFYNTSYQSDKYSKNKRTFYWKEGEIPYKNNFRYGLKAGLSYDYDFAGFCFSPFVAIDIPLSSMVYKYNMDCTPEICAYRTDLHWKVWFSQAGIDVKYLF